MLETVKLSLEFPKPFVEDLWGDEAAASAEMKQSVVMDLLRQKRISIRKGAELLGLSYRDFLDLATRHRVSLADYEEGWIERELAAIEGAARRDE